MTLNLVVHAPMRQYSTPDWEPLEAVLPSHELCGHFMWMNDAVIEVGVLNCYKHRLTRRYLHLDDYGHAFAYLGEHRYRRVDLHAALTAVFDGWERSCRPTQSELRAVEAALAGARQEAFPSGSPSWLE